MSPNLDPLNLPSEPSPDSEPDPAAKARVTPRPNPTLHHLAFNQEFSCYSAATDSGFRVYTCDPFRRCDCDSSGPRGSVRLVQMLLHCHYFALVGGGPDPSSPPDKVMIWDDLQSKYIKEINFRSEIKSVRLRHDRIVVTLLRQVYVYGFTSENRDPLDSFVTVENPKGLCEVSYKSGPAVLACPGLHPGQIRVEHYGSRRTKFIMAHSSELACFALTQDGQFLATASCKGTLIRVFNTVDGTLLREVRRGADKAEIYSLAFSPTGQWLAVSSDKGTVHVFSVKVDTGSLGNEVSCSTPENGGINPSTISSLSYFKAVLPRYFSSEWSLAKFRLQEGVHYIVAFGHQKNTIIIVGMDGSFYRCQFDPVNGGEMVQLEYANFLELE